MRKSTVHLEQCDQCKAEQGDIQLSPDYSFENFTADHKSLPSIALSTRTGLEEPHPARSNASAQPTLQGIETAIHTVTYRATLALSGMTCSSCVSSITHTVQQLPSVRTVNINLLTGSGVIAFEGNDHIQEIIEAIEDCGFEASVDRLEVLPAATSGLNAVARGSPVRNVSIHIDGMFCGHCPSNIRRRIKDKFGDFVVINEPPLTLTSPTLHIEYLPAPPNFTIRLIFDTITSNNLSLKLSVYHPPTIEERAGAMHAAERRRTMRHLIVCIIVALPTFILGIAFMSLVPANNQTRKYIMEPLTGNATRLSWALFILAIPVYVYSAKSFHIRTYKELRSMWRPRSHTPLLQRFTRFGSMNMLISLGTSIALFASIAELVLAATKKSSGSMDNSYFDAVVFLTMFLLVGRYLEALSKAKTGDAVTSLGKLRPHQAVLVDETTGDIKVPTDLLEVNDIVRVHHGTSPPFDGILVEGSSNFDESSLTGESRLVKKNIGDSIYSGTVNKAMPVKMKITTISGSSMLDQIINAVREGQTRRAHIERVADTITAHFVPFVVLVAVMTWLIWLILGTTGTIPKDWRDEETGGWPLWSLRFAIAVFVIACPCGIGLAAPTALFVGGGLAAKHGILVRGGGEAFQEASSLDCIVFDKTGTLTQGGSPAVTDHRFINDQDRALAMEVVKKLEENSGHPIAQALVKFCNRSQDVSKASTVVTVDEIPGKGLKATLNINGQSVTAIVGNETHLADHNVSISSDSMHVLESWKARGESVALVAWLSASTQNTWRLAGMFSIADPLRPEAIGVVQALKKRGINVWMLSGDNPTTANAVGVQVGIPATNIIAGVLPDEKARKIEYLQQTLTKSRRSALFQLPAFLSKNRATKRATIAMVGDGINDAPALSTADLSIAIGSGSDIALSSSSFILINSQLTTILTLLDLSRVVFRRVYFNFGWATVYNLVAMPIAAGVLFPITIGGKVDDHRMHNGEKHVRLDPVWASLAMALSSLSVVCSSLALRSRLPWVGFQANKDEMEEVEVAEERAAETV
ncbi:heavy metal translocatin [Didymella exigua CBS 183.55]|uniref:Heavy metal translocatin n=1 Tax=Didymella exigua CBS 183.55 TaxID=1150837 RepID=A0A6A5RV10_9PLEO|nr:heavy metal translocatin [Didymella exigua CBS 183.55]KAF1932291.1 heavy metal translocatin [Didymella exigua CBS 183.55]